MSETKILKSSPSPTLQATLIPVDGDIGCYHVYEGNSPEKKSSRDSENNHAKDPLFTITAEQIKLIEAIDALDLPHEVKIRLRLGDISCPPEISTVLKIKPHNRYLAKVELTYERDEAAYLKPLLKAFGRCNVLAQLGNIFNSDTQILSIECSRLNFSHIEKFGSFYAEERKKIQGSLFYIKNSVWSSSLVVLLCALIMFIAGLTIGIPALAPVFFVGAAMATALSAWGLYQGIGLGKNYPKHDVPLEKKEDLLLESNQKPNENQVNLITPQPHKYQKIFTKGLADQADKASITLIPNERNSLLFELR